MASIDVRVSQSGEEAHSDERQRRKSKRPAGEETQTKSPYKAPDDPLSCPAQQAPGYYSQEHEIWLGSQDGNLWGDSHLQQRNDTQKGHVEVWTDDEPPLGSRASDLGFLG